MRRAGRSTDMGLGVLFALSLPGLVVLLVLLASVEGFGRWLRGSGLLPWRRTGPAGGGTLSATSMEELDAFFSGAKRVELDARQSHSMMRDEQQTGAPPWIRVDLNAGTAIVTRPDSPPPSPTPR